MTKSKINQKKALKALAEIDPDLGRAIQLIGPLPDRARTAGFPTLLRILCEQQLSVASAAAIWGRVEKALVPLTPQTWAAADDRLLRGLGLSRAKVAYGRYLATAIAEGAVDLDRLHTLDDAEAAAHLVQVKGIGRWTAEIYLLFALERPDIWPADDLALQEGLRLLKRMRKRPDRARMDKIAKPWRPYRGLAARVLWRYYGLAKKGELGAD